MKTGSVPRTRRAFLAGMAGTALAPLEARTSMYNPLLAARTATWLPLSVDPEAVFAGIAGAGYTRVVLDAEFTSPALAPTTRQHLRKHRLSPVLANFACPYEELADAARLWREIGLRGVEVPATSGADPRRVTLAGHDLDRMGMRLLLRTTPASLAGDGRLWQSLVAGTESRVVNLSVDVAEVADPLALLDSSSARLASVNLQSRRDGLPAEEVGEGQPDMPPLAAFLRRISYDGYLTVDLPALPSRGHTIPMSLAHSRWYVHQVFGMRPGAPPVDMGPHVRTRRQ